MDHHCLSAELFCGPHAAIQFRNRICTPHPLRDQQAGCVHRKHRHLVSLGELDDGIDVLGDRLGPHHQLDAVVAECRGVLEGGLGPQRIYRGRRQTDLDCGAHVVYSAAVVAVNPTAAAPTGPT
jgi:hypothetical protein